MKTKIIYFLILALIPFINIAQDVIAVRHCATAATIDGEITEIDSLQLNDNPDLVVVVEKVRVDDNGTIINNPHFVGVRYNSLSGRWYIHNENPADDMIENSCYKLLALDKSDPRAIEDQFTVIDVIPGFLEIAPIDDPYINDNPSVRCLFSKFQDSNAIQNNNPCEMYYNYETPGNWYITTTTGQEMPLDCAFNIICDPDGFAIYEHQSDFDNIGSEVVTIDDYAYWTELDHVLINGNSNAFIMAQPRREPSTGFVLRSDSVFYNSVTGKWEVHIELESFISGFNFPEGRFYDVFIFDGTMSIDEVAQKESIKVFPNPVTDILTLESLNAMNKVEIFNLLGQKIDEINGEGSIRIELDLSHYITGNYFAKIQSENKVKTIQIIKN